MTVKENVLLLLGERAGEYISGEEIADRLSVSRTAVWKAINALRDEGCAVEAVTNRGYRMVRPVDVLSAAVMEELLAPLDEYLRVEVYDSVDSTNSLLQRRAAEGEEEGLIAVSESQTQGRGRKRRAYFSPPGSGLYFSILLRPKFSLTDSPFLTVAAAAAAARAIETVSGRETQIKWVNDVWMDGKKICGILTEASVAVENSRLDYAIVGIGVNVYQPDSGFPEDLAHIASAVFPSGEMRQNIRNRLLVEIVGNFMRYYRHLADRPFFEEYKKRSFTIGRQVTVICGEENRTALVLDVDSDCHLLVRYEDGTAEALNSGEISIKV